MPTSRVVEQPAELLAFLFAAWPEVKRTKVRQWLKHGAVEVNGRSVTRFNHPLKQGDVISIRAKKDVAADEQLPRGMKILFEDAALLVIEKPAGLLSMASETERRKTAYAFLTDHVRHGNRRGAERVWIVHRLDREASGLMVFAKTEAVKHSLQSTWRDADKRYLAVIEGRLSADEGVFSSYLDESGPFKVYSAPPSEQARRAVTNYRVVRQSGACTLVELSLETGRRNQIRVHLADAGCPIVGDAKYGARTDPVGRLGLHATSLAFNHPSSCERLKFESPLPRVLAQLV